MNHKTFVIGLNPVTWAPIKYTSPKSKIRLAHIQPLNLVELDVFEKENREIGRVHEIRISYPYRELNFNVFKNCISVFLNEVLVKTLKESEANPELFSLAKQKKNKDDKPVTKTKKQAIFKPNNLKAKLLERIKAHKNIDHKENSNNNFKIRPGR